MLLKKKNLRQYLGAICPSYQKALMACLTAVLILLPIFVFVAYADCESDCNDTNKAAMEKCGKDFDDEINNKCSVTYKAARKAAEKKKDDAVSSCHDDLVDDSKVCDEDRKTAEKRCDDDRDACFATALTYFLVTAALCQAEPTPVCEAAAYLWFLIACADCGAAHDRDMSRAEADYTVCDERAVARMNKCVEKAKDELQKAYDKAFDEATACIQAASDNETACEQAAAKALKECLEKCDE